MILEAIVTTIDAKQRVNVAAMGAQVHPGEQGRFSRLLLRPFKTSRTYANLRVEPTGVFHVTDDVLLFAQSVLGEVDPPLRAARMIRGRRLVDCCRFFEFRVIYWNEVSERAALTAEIVHEETIRDFFGFNRAKHAVLEAAILVSRLHLLGRETVRHELNRLATVVEKTAGPAERTAFALLQERARLTFGY